MRKLLGIFLLLVSVHLWAGDLEEGNSALEQGDYQKAFTFFKKAAEQGNGEAQYWLGTAYKNGFSGQQDFKQAAYWYQKAVDQNILKAYSSLAYLYQTGQGVPRDIQKYIALEKKAADQGYALSMVSLAICYDEGKLAPQNLKLAAEYYQKAIKSPITNENLGAIQLARYNFGLMSYQGAGVPQNKMQTYKSWFDCAKAINTPNLPLAIKQAINSSSQACQQNLDILCRESPSVCK